MFFRASPLALAIGTLLLIPAFSTAQPVSDSENDSPLLSPVIVTGEAMDSPLTVETDPKTPRQPVPAHDGADYLKTIPGFAVTRKGGTDGDPIFRGLAGSRLGISVDGENILGGCNSRMDAPTAYIYPELYDKLMVIKGPQTVTHGPMNSAATISFERQIEPFDTPGYRLHASALLGSAGRHDELLDVQAGARSGYLQATGSNSQSSDYRDGNGDKVHGEYHRYGGQIAVGVTPDKDSRIEISANQSDGEAAYADRGMDGTQFLRNSQNFKAEKKNLNRIIKNLEFHAYENSVDHIMDDQELRKPGMMGYANLKRETDGGRAATTLALTSDDQLTLGLDQQRNDHTSRSAHADHLYTAWANDASFDQKGMFAEYGHDFSERYRLVTGYRSDRWEATDKRAMIMTSMMPATMKMNPTSGNTRKETLGGGFIRLEHDLASSPTVLYAGIGRAERFPDYWELISKRGDGSISAFDTRSETTTQYDMGALYKTKDADLSASIFYANTDDFILVDYTNMMVANGYSRNVDTKTYGGEFSGAYRLNQSWRVDSSVAWVWGENKTDQAPLAQTPPLEGRLGLTYSQANWSLGGLIRAVERQDRYDSGRGTIVGQDFAPEGGFSVFSLNASWKPRPDTLLTTGIDNLFDRVYSEFVSRAGGNGMTGAIPGYVQTDRVNEPGRTLWAKVQFDL